MLLLGQQKSMTLKHIIYNTHLSVQAVVFFYSESIHIVSSVNGARSFLSHNGLLCELGYLHTKKNDLEINLRMLEVLTGTRFNESIIVDLRSSGSAHLIPTLVVFLHLLCSQPNRHNGGA